MNYHELSDLPQYYNNIVIKSKTAVIFYRIKYLQNNGGILILSYLQLSDLPQYYNNITIKSKAAVIFYRIKYL